MITVKKIPKIKTQDGHMIPVYRDWDIDTNGGYTPKMVYSTTLGPYVVKDIILHERRSAYMTCIAGNVVLEALIDGEIVQYQLDYDDQDDNINLLLISPGVPIKLINMSDRMSIILNCPNPAWHPEDQDTIKFKSWSDFISWKQTV